MANKKMAIVCDDYKLNKFKKELKEAGFKNVTIQPNTKGKLTGTTTIQVKTDESNLQKVHAICINVEAYFKRQN